MEWSRSASVSTVSRPYSHILIAALFCGALCLATASAQSPLSATFRIEGPSTLPAGEEAVLTAGSLNAVSSEALRMGAYFEWLINETPRNTGDVLRCRSREPATYRIRLNLVGRQAGQKTILATDSRILTFAPRRLRAAPSAAAPRPAASARPPESASGVWQFRGQRDWLEDNRVVGVENKVSIRSNEYNGISFRPCFGTVVSRVTWTPLPETLTPGRTLSIELLQELELTADPDPECPRGPLPRATANAKFFVLTDARHERIQDTISEGARAEQDRFSKSKLVQWRVPAGRAGDEMTIELGGESPAGSASRFYTYEFVAKPAAAGAKPAVSTRPPEAIIAPGAPLQVTLDTSATVLPLGATARVHATITGGRPPYRIFWTFRGAAAGENVESLAVRLVRAGDQPVSIRVTDAARGSADAELLLTAQSPDVRIARTRPSGDRVFVEEVAEFKAEIAGGATGSPGDFAFRWRSDSAAVFEPAEGLEPATTARFYKPGPAQIWVELLHLAEAGVHESVGRSEAITLQVMPPDLQITFNPVMPHVGQEIRAVATTRPELKEVEFRWNSIPPNMTVLARSADFREIRLCLKNEEPAEIKVSAVLPRFGQIAVEATGKIRARDYAVRIAGPTPSGAVPKVWKAGAGLVPLENRHAADQALGFSAELSPAAHDAALTYEWSSPQSSCAVRDAASANPTVVCSDTGRYEIAVRVRDSAGIELGSGRATFDIEVSRRELEDSRKQARAQELRDEGFILLRQDKLKEAITRYRESLALWPSDEVRKHVAQLEKQLSQSETVQVQAASLKAEAQQLAAQGLIVEALAKYKESVALVPDAAANVEIAGLERQLAGRKKKQEAAKALREDGRKLEERGKLREALAIYARSYEAWPDDDLKQHIAATEGRLAEEEQLQARARTLQAEGSALEKQGDLKGAIGAYKRSLEAWAEPALQKRVWLLESEISRREAGRKQAQLLRNEAQLLIDSKKYDEAVAKYRKSLELEPDPELEARVQQIEAALATRRAKQADAKRLQDEGLAFETAGRLADAVSRYRESLAAWANDPLEARVKDLEKKLADEQAAAAQAAALDDEGLALENNGRLDEAVAKYRESLALHPSQATETRIAMLERMISRRESESKTAARLREEGVALEQEGRIEAALVKYRESLRAMPDDELAAHAAKLEKSWQDEAAARERADALREEAQVLLLQDRTADAIARYRESLTVQPSVELERHVKMLEDELARKRRTAGEAAKLAEEAARLEKKKAWTDALALYRKSLALQPDDALRTRMEAVEDRIAEEDATRKQAARLRDDAYALLLEEKTDESIAKYRESLALVPDKALEDHVKSLEEQVRRRKQAQEKAARLREDALALEQKGNLEAAAKKLHESLNLQADADTRTHLAKLEARIREKAASQEAANAAKKAREAAARRLRADGEQLEKDGHLREAVTKYRSSADIWPDAELDARLKAVEQKIAEQDKLVEDAARLEREGAEFERGGNLQDAVASYRSSLAVSSNEVLRSRLVLLENRLREREEAKAAADALLAEAASLEQSGRDPEALEKLRQSLRLNETEDTRRKIVAVEQRIVLRQKTSAEAARLREEGHRLRADGDGPAALAKYRDSLALRRDPEIERTVRALEEELEKQTKNRERARQLARDAGQLDQQGNLEEALALYRKSLAAHPDDAVQKSTWDLESRIAGREARRTDAARLRDEAYLLITQDQPEAAIAKYRQSLAIWPDALLEEHVQALEARQAQRQKDLELAERLRNEGAALERDGKLAEAAAKYRESLQLQPDSATQIQLAQIEGALRDELTSREAAEAAQKARKTAAQKLAAEGEKLEKDGKLREAVAKYRGSVDILPDKALEERASELEKTLAREDKIITDAARLREEGHWLRAEGDRTAAIAKYRESLALRGDADVERIIAALEGELELEKRNRELAQQLAAEAGQLDQQGKPDEALAAFRKSLATMPDDAVQKKMRELEVRIAGRDARRADAVRLRDEAHILTTQEQIEAAIAKYRESLAIWPDARLEEHVASLEARETRRKKDAELAERLRTEAMAFEQDGKLVEAAAKYRESLQIQADASTKIQLDHVESLLRDKAASEENEAAAKRARETTARQMTAEGEKLEDDGKLREAVAKYRASLDIAPDVILEKRVRALERKLADREKQDADALRLKEAAHALRADGKLDQALAKYKESLAVRPDADIEETVRVLEIELTRKKAEAELAARLRKEASTLERAGQLEDALAKYRESLQLEPHAATQAAATNLQARMTKAALDRETADKLWREGILMARGGRRAEGLVLLKQSLGFFTARDRESVVKDIERQVKAAPMPAPTRVEPKPVAKPAVAPAPKPAPAVASRAIATPSTPPRVSGTHWKGVIIVSGGKDTIQWPLKIGIGAANDISGSYRDRDAATGELVDYSVGGVYDPPSGTLYLAVQRERKMETMKATLIGTLSSSESAGGQVSLTTVGSRAAARKGIWRIVREP